MRQRGENSRLPLPFFGLRQTVRITLFTAKVRWFHRTYYAIKTPLKQKVRTIFTVAVWRNSFSYGLFNSVKIYSCYTRNT